MKTGILQLGIFMAYHVTNHLRRLILVQGSGIAEATGLGQHQHWIICFT
jgi:hypothetical protein